MMRRLKLFKSLLANDIRPEWMITDHYSGHTPGSKADGGAWTEAVSPTSDLNDLYSRVINRNNRLKQLLELNAPEVICRNEKRMLQEAVDALIDNSSSHSKTVIASTGQKRMLKSLADSLKGKTGKFQAESCWEKNRLFRPKRYRGKSEAES
jgi:DNA-directed RNA polymerase subunit beta'